MKNPLILACSAAALVAVAACNSAEREAAAPAPDNESVAVANVADNVAAPAPVDLATIMHDRHENYEEMGKAMKGISDQLKADAPALDTIRRNAALIASYGPQIPTWFPQGSGPESGRRTRAKAEIWSDPETFRVRAQAFQAESARFERIVQGGDVEAIRAAMPALGTSCKNCHDRFRAPER